MKILVTQIGARRHYAVPAALERAGLLAGLYTDVCMAAPWLRLMGRIIPNSLPIPGWKSLVAREPIGVPDAKIACLWSAPWALRRFKERGQTGGQYARFVLQNAAFGRDVVDRGFGAATAVYAFNGAAVEIFEAAHAQGLTCLLDMTIAPLEVIERLLSEERIRFPNLELGAQIPNPPEALIDRERREWELADVILCGSEYVSDSLIDVGVPASKCRVVRWGYSGPKVQTDRTQRTGPLRVLIAGTVDLRKGVPYALEAARLLADARFHFRFVGPIHLDLTAIQAQYTDRISGTTIEFVGPVPRSAMTGEYQDADVLLHPSLAEGSANVCYEALAHGLPVIATPNAGSTVESGRDGWIVPIRDSSALAAALRKVADRSLPSQNDLKSLHSQSTHTALGDYQQQLEHVLRGVVQR